MTPPTRHTPHALYRFYDADGALLYVGITLNPAHRWAKHAHTKPWWQQVAQITLDTYPDRDSVLAAEQTAIRRERPRHNVVHNRTTPLRTMVEQNDIMLALVGADPADGPFGTRAEHMPDDCHEHCVKAGITSIYYPFVWHHGRGHYLCAHGHYWTCGWGHDHSGSAASRAAKPVSTVTVTKGRP